MMILNGYQAYLVTIHPRLYLSTYAPSNDPPCPPIDPHLLDVSVAHKVVD